MFCSIDVETSMKPIFKPWQAEAYLSTVAIYTSEGKEYTWVFTHNEAAGIQTDREKVQEIQQVINDSSMVCAHNFKFDLLWLHHMGLVLEDKKIFCTQVAEFLLNSQRLGDLSLNDLAKKYFNDQKIDIVKEQYWDRGIDTKYVPLSILLEYNIKDSELTTKIAREQMKLLKEKGMLKLVRIEMEKIKCLATIEYFGMAIDVEELEKQYDKQSRALGELDRRVYELVGREFNIDSSDQLSVALFGGVFKVAGKEWVRRPRKDGTVREYQRNCILEQPFKGLGFKPDKQWAAAKEGFFSTSKDVLVQLAGRNKKDKEIFEVLIERSAIAQEIKTFLQGIKDRLIDGRVHPTMNNTVAVTGRLSCSNPNLQNIKRDANDGGHSIKDFFIPTKGAFTKADFSQLEWRVAALLSQCPVMLEEICSGRDQHQATGDDVFGGAGIRTDWKIFNFRMIYGGSAFSYFMDYKMPAFSKKKWEGIVETFYEKYHGLDTWHSELVKSVKKNKGNLTNPTGRTFKFVKYTPDRGGPPAYSRPQILNYPVQSLAADIVNLAMLKIQGRIKQEGLDAVMCNQVHDEIMFDHEPSIAVPVAKVMLEEMNRMPQYIEDYYGIHVNIPLGGDAKTGPRWGQMEEV